MKILITGGNHAKALKLLKAFPNHFILFADYGEVPGISAVNYAFSSLGELNKDSIAHILLNFCITESIDSIIPLHDFEVEPIAKSAVLFGEYGIDVLLPSPEDLNNYLNLEKTVPADFGVFVKGACIYATAEKPAGKCSEKLNGVFNINQSEKLTLFTL